MRSRCGRQASHIDAADWGKKFAHTAGTVSRGESAASVVLGSFSAVDGDRQSSADIAHSAVAEHA